jgi:hypothetical protein
VRDELGIEKKECAVPAVFLDARKPNHSQAWRLLKSRVADLRKHGDSPLVVSFRFRCFRRIPEFPNQTRIFRHFTNSKQPVPAGMMAPVES